VLVPEVSRLIYLLRYALYYMCLTCGSSRLVRPTSKRLNCTHSRQKSALRLTPTRTFDPSFPCSPRRSPRPSKTSEARRRSRTVRKRSSSRENSRGRMRRRCPRGRIWVVKSCTSGCGLGLASFSRRTVGWVSPRVHPREGDAHCSRASFTRSYYRGNGYDLVWYRQCSVPFHCYVYRADLVG
jgi:hypothetical protein